MRARHPILFVETFVDPELTGYLLLSNQLGRVRAHDRSRQERWSKKPNRPIKEVLGYPLTSRFRELLEV
jgi:hypothetical protein